ncbi:hypothetical protein RHMOL_Rhmol01G0030400 [Rhododendron molle]|uniref:Uncharacterized protein n=1 Tax=Rhododendron molle TaxID=49168 RepID=A0ACC0PYZ3_RHOML|nr:hypothetical protein RHMOL_Rhmol01G0030400 [Rhododendron molle]
MNQTLIDFCIAKAFLDQLHTLSKQIHVQFLEPRASVSQPHQRPRVPAHILLVPSLELCHEMIHQSPIEIHPTQVGISCRSFHYKNPLFDSQNRNISTPSTQGKNQYILLPFS